MFNLFKVVFFSIFLFTSCAQLQKKDRLAPELYRAASQGNLSLLATVKDEDIDRPTETGTTLLMVAARRGNLASVDYLLARGAQPNLADIHKQTSLHYSLPAKSFRISESLIKAGGDPSSPDLFETIPVLMWAEDGAFDLVLLALQKKTAWCCYSEVKGELHKIISAAAKENKYIPPSLFLVLRDLGEG